MVIQVVDLAAAKLLVTMARGALTLVHRGSSSRASRLRLEPLAHTAAPLGPLGTLGTLGYCAGLPS